MQTTKLVDHERAGAVSIMRRTVSQRMDSAETYETYHHRLTHKQFSALRLWGQGFTQEEIAHLLGCGRSAISARLKRAKAVIEHTQRERRREAVELGRQLAAEEARLHDHTSDE